MLTTRRAGLPRRAAINASTVFGLTLAIVAGLIFTLVFKMVVLDQKPAAPAPAPAFKLTVASANLTDKMIIEPRHVRTIAVSEEERGRWLKEAAVRKTRLLDGSQPVARTTIKPVRAEEPIFEDMLEPMQYPRPVSEMLAAGKRAVIIEVPANQAMIQVGDTVDCLCTLGNDSPTFGPGHTATANIARNARVVARFNSTRTAVQPPPNAPKRTYTLEVSPYRYALIELAKHVGATFALSVAARSADEGGAAGNGGGVLQSASLAESDDPDSDNVTTADLARLFGMADLPPERVWEVERFSGLEKGPSLYYDSGVAAPAQKTTGARTPAPAAGRSTGAVPPTRVQPAGKQTSGLARPLGGAVGLTMAVALSSANRPNSGFKAPYDPNAPGCKTCGGKR